MDVTTTDSEDTMSVQGKAIIVTGASSGIGMATVQRLAEHGARIVFGARREDKLEELAGLLPSGRYAYAATDVSNFDDVQHLVDLSVERFGKVDALFNNAGIMPLSTLSEGKRDDWQRMLQTNIMGLLNGISAVLPVMHRQGYGHILATGSMAGYNLYPGAAVYCGTKFAERAIMEGLRREEHGNGIKTTYVAPGMVDTQLYESIGDEARSQEVVSAWHEHNHSLTPDDIARFVEFAIAAPERMVINEVSIRPLAED
ncbi:SDR family oxidoreductase [Bifidobacterium sp.]|jgi:NADP-dependent 3-hydroxy acid dehydrogenase YdfG|uniref:SDR family oxidoreductase n=1 Tax=Bifidobacterium sp. TaxID=41200 RepID=UPI0025BE6BB8|nr:SDR family oxidoreductase [Bifidobacterium sp.]MCI1634606.1 SDR family oxidoreductase [Bifidobacterium sp.]